MVEVPQFGLLKRPERLDLQVDPPRQFGKQMYSPMKHHYVYELSNISNGMKYIGARTCCFLPIEDVRYLSSSKYVKKAIVKYGIGAFKKTILKEFDNREDAIAYEIFLHQKYNVDFNEQYYNKSKQKTTGFDTSSLVGEKNHMYGKHLSIETKEKLRIANLNKPSPWKGRHWSAEQIENIRFARIGSKANDTTKEKHRQQMLGVRIGAKHPMFGKHHSEESKAKTSKALRGIAKSESMRKKLSITQRIRACGFSGHRHSEETRKKISISLLDRYKEKVA